MFIGLIYGPMFSGKTSSLVNYINTCGDPNRLVFKSSKDTRTGTTLSSHDPSISDKIGAIPLNSLFHLVEWLTPKTQYVFIDEAQFFDKDEVRKTLDILRKKYPGLCLIFAGLNSTWQGKSFPTITYLLSKANDKHFCQGDCSQCGAPTTHSYLIDHDKQNSLEIVGGEGAYEGRCYPCYSRGMKLKGK